MGSVESKRCHNIRRVLIALFIVCGYMLSTTFAGAYFDIDGKETFVPMTALNLALGLWAAILRCIRISLSGECISQFHS